MNLFEIMRAAAAGNGFAALAPSYGLSPEEMSRAAEAFLPAFSAVLKRTTSDPVGYMEFMRQLAVANYGRAYENPAWLRQGGQQDANAALRFFFGSTEIAQAMVRQASAFTGIPEPKLSDMLPALSAMMLGGLAHQATSSNPWLGDMLKGFASAPRKETEAKGPLDRYEEEQERKEEEAKAAARAQAELMQAGLAAFQAGTAAWQSSVASMMKSAGGGAPSADNVSPEAVAPGGDVFRELLEPGLKLSEAYRREIEKLAEAASRITRS